jgi:NCAIR mutase (PurE)-related protein
VPPAHGFAPLLVDLPAPADPPLGLGGPADPPLGPVPAPVVPARSPEVVAAPEPEVVRGTGRSTEQVLALVREARREHPDRPAIVLRAAPETLVALAGEHDACTTMDAAAMAAAVGPVPEPVGRVAVLSGAGSDAPVAAEVAFVARVTGTEAARVEDADDPALLAGADCVVVVAGLEASLAGRIAAATDVPVVAVPTSSGQTGGFAGLGALLTMVSTPTPGVVVSTVDDGWSAGVFAARIARRTAR